MKTLLEELYNGNVFPNELIVPRDPEYTRLNAKISEAIETWREKLSADDFKRLDSLIDLVGESGYLVETDTFIYGFRLGAGIMLEVMAEKDSLYRNIKEDL